MEETLTIATAKKNNITMTSGDNKLDMTPEGFFYNGVHVEDVDEIYRRFGEFLTAMGYPV